MAQQYQEFMKYVNMDLFNWTIKEDAPEWAKEEFKKFMKELNNKDVK